MGLAAENINKSTADLAGAVDSLKVIGANGIAIDFKADKETVTGLGLYMVLAAFVAGLTVGIVNFVVRKFLG